MPLIGAGASPVLAYNLILLLGFVLTGWTTNLIVERWTGDWLAGVVSRKRASGFTGCGTLNNDRL